MSSKLGVENIAHTNGTNAMTISSGGVITANNGINLGNQVLDSYREGNGHLLSLILHVISGSDGMISAKYKK